MAEMVGHHGVPQGATTTTPEGRDLDGQLAGRIARGDPDALAELYDRYAPLLLGLVGRLLPDPHDREEVLQETFLTVWRKAAGYDGRRGRLSSWLVSIAHHKAIDLLRRKRRQAPPTTPIDPAALITDDRETWQAPGVDTVGEQVQALDSRQAVQRALGQLRPEERQVVWLAYFQGYTHREIATFFSIPLGTVKSRMRSAVDRLRSLLSAADGETYGR